MMAGYLSEFFTGISMKRLSAVEADQARSHQHEYNGDKDLIKVFGKATDKQPFKALYIYFSDSDDEPIVAEGTLTWYDARLKHKTRTEHRLYFPANQVSLVAAEGDSLIVGLRPDSSVLVVVAQGESAIASQLQWLFSPTASQQGFSLREELENNQNRVQFAADFIRERLGINQDLLPARDNDLDTMVDRFGDVMPGTKAFSEYARSTTSGLDAVSDPDAALLGWMDREEALYRTFERHRLGDQLQRGFVDDVDGFITFSLSVQNTRKKRAGDALENHLEAIFNKNELRFNRGATTEGRKKVDFLFPGAAAYHDSSFDPGRLTTLAAKTSLKDRWRQVLAEAGRVSRKHLLTLQPGISSYQTEEIRESNLQLVIPRGLQNTFTAAQQTNLIDLGAFTAYVRERESA